MNTLKICPVCGSSDLAEAYHFTDKKGKTFRVDRCQSCTHGFVNPQPTWDELEPYYNETYTPYDTDHAFNDLEEVVREAQKEGKFRHVAIRPGLRVLDIGCGGGRFLQVVARLGAQVKGVDPSPIAAQRAQSCGIDVFCGTVEQFAAGGVEEPFDIITLNHVFEHVPQPVKLLSLLKELLRPGGYIWLGLPNAGNWACRTLRQHWHATDIPRHLQQFTFASIAMAGQKAELTPRLLATESLPHATARSMRQWAKYKLSIPESLTSHLPILNTILAKRLGARTDRHNNGDALLAEFAA